MDLLSHGSQCKPAKVSDFNNKLNAYMVKYNIKHISYFILQNLLFQFQ